MCVDYLTEYTILLLYFDGEKFMRADQAALLFFQDLVRYLGILTSVIHDLPKIHQFILETLIETA